MGNQWRVASIGALAGAAIAIAATFVFAYTGVLPRSPASDAKAFHAYLLEHPDVVVEMTNKLSAQEAALSDKTQADVLQNIGMRTFFDPKIAFVTGPTNAKMTLVEFFDYNCPYCRASVPALKKYYEAHKNDTRFSFIEFPIKGPNSIIAARAGLAARNQPDRYLPFHFALMNEEGMVTEDIVYADAAKAGLDVAKLKADMNSKAIDQAIDTAHKLAIRAKIDGTPTFIVNGKLRPGALDFETLDALMKGKAA
jgi:protein-disulfide isomerase